MYEVLTYEYILDRMLSRVSENIDKREGSVIYTALAPAAAELTQMYIELSAVLNESFADTQSREYLIKRCSERGIYPDDATKAILKGVFNVDIPIGSRFSLDSFNYTVIEKISAGIFKLECETAGSEGNQHLGSLIPIEYINGLSSAELTEVLIPGEDEEDTEELRNRYFNSLDTQSFGGNISDYKEKTNSINGVGGVRVYPAWNGGGTVRLVIIDSTHKAPSSVLIDTVQTAIDPIQNHGRGAGIAPIGHFVTVQGVTETAINISTNITYQAGWTWSDIEPYVNNIIDEYFIELNKSWAESETLIVRISQIETRLLDIAGVVDIAETTINGAAQNLTLDPDNIPTRGEIIG